MARAAMVTTGLRRHAGGESQSAAAGEEQAAEVRADQTDARTQSDAP